MTTASKIAAFLLEHPDMRAFRAMRSLRDAFADEPAEPLPDDGGAVWDLVRQHFPDATMHDFVHAIAISLEILLADKAFDYDDHA
jgi:hypothetical protein